VKKAKNTLKISDAQQRTPASGVGEWAQALHEATFNAVTEQDMADVMKVIVDKAKSGDLGAAKLLLGYVTPSRPAAAQQVVMVQHGTPEPPPIQAATLPSLAARVDADDDDEQTEAELDALIRSRYPTMPGRRNEPTAPYQSKGDSDNDD
jgi:hypothetical protein